MMSRRTETAPTQAGTIDSQIPGRSTGRREAGDFEAFFRRQYPPLVKTLCVITMDREAAADTAQESFVKLFVRWHRFAGDEDRARWLFRVAINRSKDVRRSLVRTRLLLKRLAGEYRPRDEVAWYPERQFIEALKDLPGRQRTAAALHYVAGLPQKETADVMGISEGAVKSHLFRAREALSAKLEGE